MTATVIQLKRSRGRGRQPAEVELVRDTRDELTAFLAETAERYARLLATARQAQRHLARGWSPANALDDMERDLVRGLNQVAAAAVQAAPICPDGADVRHIGHGRAA